MTEIKRVFCPKCHRLVASIIKDDDTTRITQGDKSIISLKGGIGASNISVNCPSGHSVKIS